MIRAGLMPTALVAVLLAAMAVKGELLSLPSRPDVPAAGRFDADRAAARLARVLGDQRAHPVDSAANDSVRARLITELHGLGLQPRVTDDFVCNGFVRGPTIGCARVRNVIASIGPPAGRHLLLNAHYDSTFAGPGAGDDGIGVATLLEVAALLRGRPLARPVTFLFNEGEETGLLGARAFLDRDPLAARVDALLNFEARGVTGPATMFETSRPNGRALAHFARAADRPLANSLTTDLYRLIPNYTDVSVFAALDWTILNFAVIGNETRYHSAGDDLAALDRRSLQHMGDQGLALALDFAGGESVEAGGEHLYADFLGRQLVTLPLMFGLILLAILLLYFTAEAWRRRALGRPAGAILLAVVGAAAVAFLGQLLIGFLGDGDYWRGYPLVTSLAVYASAIAAGLLVFSTAARAVGARRLRSAYWLVFVALGTAIALLAPGGAIYFLFPPLVAALAMAISRRRETAEKAGAWAAILLLYLTFAPALAMFEELMSNGPHWMFAPIGAAVLLPALIEAKPFIDRLPRGASLAAAGGLFAAAWAAVGLTPAYSRDRQQLFTIDYVWDEAAGRGRWAVNNDGRRVPFAAPWRRAELPHSPRRRWVAPAPALPVTAPRVELVGSRDLAGGRHLRIRLRSNGAESVTLLAPHEARLSRAGTAGAMLPFGRADSNDRFMLRCIGRSCDGAVIDLAVNREGPVALTVVGTRTGLPAAAGPLVRARPALARPQYSPDSTLTLATVRL
ncbi:MAG TPA: M20/M25/M40 family metallo-hydrolase [Allosphingosinicella sp.]